MSDSRQSRSDAALWSPSAERIQATLLERFRARFCPDASDSHELWRWSVEEPGAFWRAMWEFAGVAGEPGARDIALGEAFWETRFLPDARLNVAENLLLKRAGADDQAIIAIREDGTTRELDWHSLRGEVAALAEWMRERGVGPGDRVAAWMPHIPETIIAFLAASSLGAVFTSTSADFGVDGVVDRFGQTEPKILIAADGYLYNGKRFECLSRLAKIESALPQLEATIVVDYLGAATPSSDNPGAGGTPVAQPGALSGLRAGVHYSAIQAAHRGAELRFDSFPFDHPLFVLYSSGTTGKPKCIVHRAGGVFLKLLVEHQLHCDIHPGDRVFYFTTCGWMMWNWLVAGLAAGATIVLYDGSPVYPQPSALFDWVDRFDISFLGVSAKFLDGSMKAKLEPKRTHRLAKLKTIGSTGSPLSPEAFEWVYHAIGDDVHLTSMSGGTDLCGCLVAGDPTQPVYAGEIQRRGFGMGVEVFDDDGNAVGPGVQGELVCTTPFPSMPLRFWGDEDGSRYRRAYFEGFDGVWTHGDYASWTSHGGMIIHGRSDATLNASGVRIGTAEIYRVVENFEEVLEAIAIGQEWDNDTRIVLFVRLAEGASLSPELKKRIRAELRSRCTPRHVPAIIAEVSEIPRTRSGKIVELAVREIVHGRPVKNREAIANPEALEQFAKPLPERDSG